MATKVDTSDVDRAASEADQRMVKESAREQDYRKRAGRIIPRDLRDLAHSSQDWKEGAERAHKRMQADAEEGAGMRRMSEMGSQLRRALNDEPRSKKRSAGKKR